MKLYDKTVSQFVFTPIYFGCSLHLFDFFDFFDFFLGRGWLFLLNLLLWHRFGLLLLCRSRGLGLLDSHWLCWSWLSWSFLLSWDGLCLVRFLLDDGFRLGLYDRGLDLLLVSWLVLLLSCLIVFLLLMLLHRLRLGVGNHWH